MRPVFGWHASSVHLLHSGLPIVGDRIYHPRGALALPLPTDAPVPQRQCLHASTLAFDHPTTGERVRCEAPLPADLKSKAKPFVVVTVDRVGRAANALILLVLFVALMIEGIDYAWRTRFQASAALQISMAWVYAGMPIGCLLMLLHLAFIARRYVLGKPVEHEDNVDRDVAAAL